MLQAVFFSEARSTARLFFEWPTLKTLLSAYEKSTARRSPDQPLSSDRFEITGPLLGGLANARRVVVVTRVMCTRTAQDQFEAPLPWVLAHGLANNMRCTTQKTVAERVKEGGQAFVCEKS